MVEQRLWPPERLRLPASWDAIEAPARAANDPAGPAANGASAAEVARLEGQVIALQSEVAALRDRSTVTASTRPAEDPAPDPAPAGKPSSRDLEANAKVWHAHVQEADARFRQEPSDVNWATRMTATVRDVAGKSDAITTSLQSIECRTNTCRLEIREDGAGKVISQMPQFLLDVQSSLPSMLSEQVDSGNGGKMVVMYLTKGNSGT